ncbi:MAG: tRNA (guanosine(18)-2'-O)-methyltransferase TrmH [Enterobacteriaceae bacterium]
MTPERYQRICQLMVQRQPDLTVCLERVHKPHNISAIVRTADAVGIAQIHTVWPGKRMRTIGATAAGSNSWVQVKTHPDIEQAITHLKQQGMQIVAAHLDDTATDFRKIDYTRPTCILLGQEKQGITAQALALADRYITIPMQGMVQSLNVSVAGALILYEAQRQREQAGMYQRTNSPLAPEEQQRLLFEGGYPVLARVARRKGLPCPHFDDQGQIIAEPAWWTAIQERES